MYDTDREMNHSKASSVGIVAACSRMQIAPISVLGLLVPRHEHYNTELRDDAAISAAFASDHRARTTSSALSTLFTNAIPPPAQTGATSKSSSATPCCRSFLAAIRRASCIGKNDLGFRVYSLGLGFISLQ